MLPHSLMGLEHGMFPKQKNIDLIATLSVAIMKDPHVLGALEK